MRGAAPTTQSDVEGQRPGPPGRRAPARHQRGETPAAADGAEESERSSSRRERAPLGAARGEISLSLRGSDLQEQLPPPHQRGYSRRGRQAPDLLDSSDKESNVLIPPRRRVRFDTSVEAANNYSQELDEQLSSYNLNYRDGANSYGAATVARERTLSFDDAVAEGYRAGLAARGQALGSTLTVRERTPSATGEPRLFVSPSAAAEQRRASTSSAERWLSLPTSAAGARGRATQSTAMAQGCLVNRMTSAKQLPSFSGDPLDWVRFKQAFLNSTQLGKYSDSENIMRLSDALKGEARAATRALFIGGDSADEIINTLEMMFGNSKLILARILHEIGELSKIESRRVSLVEFVTRLRAAVRAIKSLKGNSEYLDSPELASKLMDKLPSAMCHSYLTYSDSIGEGVSDL